MEIDSLFKGWNVCVLAEAVATYVQTEPDFYRQNPFSCTKWTLSMKKASEPAIGGAQGG